MNIYTIHVTCSVCGGEGMATMRAASSLWLGGSLRHIDPEECARNLRRKKEELDKIEKELNLKSTNS